MPARSTILGLPDEIRQWLDGEMVKRNFADYQAVVEQLNARLAGAGLQLVVSRSALQRYGQKIEERIDGIRRSTDVARTIAREAGDDEGAMNDALARLVQDKLFNLLMDLEVDPDTIDIAKIGHVVADLGRASIAQKKHQLAVREKAKSVADDVAEKARKGGLTPQAADEIRKQILGIAT